MADEDQDDRGDETWLAELQRALDQTGADLEPAANGPALGPVLATAYTRAAREAREAAAPEVSGQDESAPALIDDLARIEAAIERLQSSVEALAERVAALNVSALARDRLEKDVHVRQLAEAAEEVRQQLETAAGAQEGFRDGVERLLERAAEGHGAEVAWTDVMLLAHELRSRVDDLDGQQRRTLRELAEWQLSVDEQLAEMRQAMLNELRRLVGEARP